MKNLVFDVEKKSATISVAGVDLIYLGLNLVLGAVETFEKAQERRAS